MKKNPIQKAACRYRRNLIIYFVILITVGAGAVGLKAYDCVTHTEQLGTNKAKLTQQQRYTNLNNEMSVIDLTLTNYMKKIQIIQGFKGYTGLTEEMTQIATKMHLIIDCKEPVLKSKEALTISFMQPMKLSGSYEDIVSFYKYLVRKEQIKAVTPSDFKVTDSHNLECNINLMILVHDCTDTNITKEGA